MSRYHHVDAMKAAGFRQCAQRAERRSLDLELLRVEGQGLRAACHLWPRTSSSARSARSTPTRTRATAARA